MSGRGRAPDVVAEDAVVHGLQALGAFADDYDVGAVDGSGAFAQASVGEHAVVEDGTVVFGDHYCDGGLDVAVLEGVVEHYHVDGGVDAEELADAVHAVFAHGYGYVAAEFAVDLVGFVADVAWCGV